ncbi:esterase/lipase family protein [Aquabacterium sp.]|uniref:esterase/lipase family protein n=1 Tax=Aquabacterium sp. TaxID=1872578 RepID=UPI0035B13B52
MNTATSTPDILTTRVHADGTQSAQSLSTPTDDQRGCEMHVLPARAIPVVFIPGIMGSNLRLSRQRQAKLDKRTDIAWRPEATMDAVAMIFKSPAQRQMTLDPEATEVDRYDLNAAGADKRHKNVADVAYLHVPGTAASMPDPHDRDRHARLRGWSEVFFSSYGELLQTLEARLNQMCLDGRPRTSWTAGQRPAVSIDPKTWGASGGEALTPDELATVSDAWYPVHAIGYNWLRSNGESAKDVAKRIREIIAYYQKLQFECDKVIVVTHSMGGLVGRALIHPDYGNAQDVVAGIVHGAMPAVGAAAAYKRIRMGFEGSGLMGYVFKKVVGDTGPKVTAVLANAPGGLQLLPSERYGTDWLKATVDGTEVLSLPQADPYAEIYTVRDKWYRLINEEWVNPANAKDSSIKSTIRKLHLAQEFHQDIGTTYHPSTYLSYGADLQQKAWGEVTWQTSKAPLLHGGLVQQLGLEDLHVEGAATGWQTDFDDGDGCIVLRDGLPQHAGQRFSAAIAKPAQSGDGTVPAERSAQDPVRQGKARIAYQQTGYDHQASYGNDAVLSSTLHAVCKIALQAFTWKTCS